MEEIKIEADFEKWRKDMGKLIIFGLLVLGAFGFFYLDQKGGFEVLTPEFIKEDVKDVEAVAGSMKIIDAVIRSNENEKPSSEEAQKKSDLWLIAKEDSESLLGKGLLQNEASNYLKEVQKRRPEFVKMFAYDKYGNLVAATQWTEKLWVGDKEYWIRSYNNAQGGFFISELDNDQEIKKDLIRVALPVLTPVTKKVIGSFVSYVIKRDD